jgi:hypothetical protein
VTACHRNEKDRPMGRSFELRGLLSRRDGGAAT